MGDPGGWTGLQGGMAEFLSGHLESDVPVGGASGSSPMAGKGSRHIGESVPVPAMGVEDQIHYFICLTTTLAELD